MISGVLSASSLLLLGRATTLNQIDAERFQKEMFRRWFLKTLFILYVIFTPAYHLLYFVIVGFSSWLSVIPTLTLIMFAAAMVIMMTTPSDPKYDPLDHSAIVGGLTAWGALITLFFASVPYYFLNFP